MDSQCNESRRWSSISSNAEKKPSYLSNRSHREQIKCRRSIIHRTGSSKVVAERDQKLVQTYSTVTLLLDAATRGTYLYTCKHLEKFGFQCNEAHVFLLAQIAIKISKWKSRQIRYDFEDILQEQRITHRIQIGWHGRIKLSHVRRKGYGCSPIKKPTRRKRWLPQDFTPNEQHVKATSIFFL